MNNHAILRHHRELPSCIVVFLIQTTRKALRLVIAKKSRNCNSTCDTLFWQITDAKLPSIIGLTGINLSMQGIGQEENRRRMERHVSTRGERKMNLPLHCILNGETAVKAVAIDEGGIAVFEYYPEDDDFRGNIRLLNRILSDDLDVEYVTAEEFNEFVERQRSKYRLDSQLRRNEKIAAMQRARKLVVRAVEEVDPERAGELKIEFSKDVESQDPEQESDLKYEEALTRGLLEAVADLNAELVKISVGAARRITGL